MGNCLRSRRNSDSLLMCGEDEDGQFALGQDQPLRQEQEIWTAEVPLTEGALQGKRDTFWETAPMYDGRREIWDALRAACEAVDQEDYDLAQAILQGASVSLPRGRLTESYDELGNRYVVPKYCISKPTNMTAASGGSLDNEDGEEPDSTTQLLQSPPSPNSPTRKGAGAGEIRRRSLPQKAMGASNTSIATMVVKVRLSTLSKDAKLTVPETCRVKDLKRKLHSEHNVDPRRVTMLFSGRVLNNGTLIKDLNVPRGFVIQAVVM